MEKMYALALSRKAADYWKPYHRDPLINSLCAMRLGKIQLFLKTLCCLVFKKCSGLIRRCKAIANHL